MKKKIEKIERKSFHWLYYFTWVVCTAIQEDEGQRSTVYCQDLCGKRLTFVFTSCTIARKEIDKKEKGKEGEKVK